MRALALSIETAKYMFETAVCQYGDGNRDKIGSI